jgi:hypothetical protein
MPTGYTAAVKEGITFEQFVMRCSRAMGALVMMRDDQMDAPIPERFEPSDYHAQKLGEAQAMLVWATQVPASEAAREAESEYREAVARHRRNLEESTDLRNKYNALLAQVIQWQPPTPEHQGLKDFMAQQLRETIRFDCNDDYYLEHPPVMLSGAAWKEAKIATAGKDVAYHSAEHAKEVERTEGRNNWLQQLRESLGMNAP